MKSKIYKSEVVENLKKKSAANKQYYPVKILDQYGNEYDALFTENNINAAIGRARKNPEDFPTPKPSSWWFFD